MKIEPPIIAKYLPTLKLELTNALKGEGLYGDHNGIVYLSEAIEALENARSDGIDHSEIAPPAWSAVLGLTAMVLQEEGLTDEVRGQILKIFWVTLLREVSERIFQFENPLLEVNLPQLLKLVRFSSERLPRA